MDLGLQGKRALVCASSKGLGLACAQALWREGATVTLSGRDGESLDSALSGFPERAFAVRADVATKDGCERLVSEAERQMGGTDILINNSGGPRAGLFEELADDTWQDGFEATLINVVRCIRLVIPGMKERGWGRILTITSSSAREPIPGLTISNALRPAVFGLTADLCRDLASSGITINCIAPGRYETDRLAHLFERRATASGRTIDEEAALSRAEVPLGRHGEVSELGNAAAFLCSDAASYITGTHLFVDGGLTRSRGS